MQPIAAAVFRGGGQLQGPSQLGQATAGPDLFLPALAVHIQSGAIDQLLHPGHVPLLFLLAGLCRLVVEILLAQVRCGNAVVPVRR